MAKENDAYAICTAQKKKSGMGHDAWKRCVDKVKKEESIMNFSERVRSIFEKRKLKNEGDEYDDIPDHEEEEDDGGAAQAAADGSLDASRKSRMKKKKIKEKGENMGEVDDQDTDLPEARVAEEVDCTARANAVKARTGSAAQAQSEYNRCKKESGDDNRDDSNPANQQAKRVMQGDRPRSRRQGRSDPDQRSAHEAKDWINKAADSIEDRGTEGKCTPIDKPGCTGKAKALAKTFKKIGKKRDAETVSKKEKAAKKK